MLDRETITKKGQRKIKAL